MLKLYNTLTRKKEEFKPLKNKKVNLFVCGPTVYDYSHIGHARTYVVFDAFVKYLHQKKYNVFYLQNITDIDDKIIKRAEEEKVSVKNLTQKFTKEYLKDMKLLKVNSVSRYAPASVHIKEVIKQTRNLFEKGFAYLSDDGIYYDISKFKNYGKLSGRTAAQAEDGVSRIDESVKKRNKGDFCLWKFSSPEEPKWPSPWGPGRPGWHIEDTAISEKYFGPQYDIHGGGRDLMFPHHEAEIAQMEASSDKSPFVQYWMHTGFLTVNKEKMSKSLGNFITIKNFAEKCPFPRNSYRILRFMVFKSHYRSPVDYNEKNIEQTYKELEKIDEFVIRLEETIKKKISFKSNVQEIIEKTRKDFQKHLNDDFNTPLALASLFSFITKVNSIAEISSSDAQKAMQFLIEMDEVFNSIVVPKKERVVQITTGIQIKKLVEKREKYRKEKEWQKADEKRKEIEKLGYQLEDTPQGPKIKKITA